MLSNAEARALQSLLEHPDGVHIPRGMHPSGAGSKTWRSLVDRGLVLRVIDPAGAGRGSTWSVTPRGREIYAGVIDALAEDFADALRDEPGDYVEIGHRVFADRLAWEDIPRWENEGGAVCDEAKALERFERRLRHAVEAHGGAGAGVVTLQARYAYRHGDYPVELLDEETGHVFGHATDAEALRALVRLVRSNEPIRGERR